MNDFCLQLQVKKKHLQEVSRRTNDARANFKRKKEEMENKKNKISGTQKRIEDLKKTLINLEGQNLSTEERAIQLHDMLEVFFLIIFWITTWFNCKDITLVCISWLKKEEKRKSAIVKEIKRQQALLFRASQHMKNLEDERKFVAMQLLGETRRTEKLTEERITVLRSMRELKESAYQTDLELQRAETRLQKLLGLEKDRAETEAKQATLKQLQAVLRDKADMLKVLQGQVNQVNVGVFILIVN